MKKVIVLGCGLVGAPMAEDLAACEEFEVSVADIRDEAFLRLKNKSIKTHVADLSDSKVIHRLVADQDLVLSAVPGFMGFNTLKTVILCNKSVVDISFFPEDPLPLDEIASQKKVIAITDCGVAPGMMHILTGWANNRMDETHNAVTYVGGLPEVREYPYQYKAVFSPVDVIEEYLRPARIIENGRLVVKEALSETELINFPGIGTLEAFNSDGIRSLSYSIKATNIKEKTLRYPGHVELMKALRDTGFFSNEVIIHKGMRIRPIEFTARLLFPKWELKEGERDLTVMKVMVDGMAAGKKVRYTWDLLDRYDDESQTHSMARTTGYTATAAINMIASGLYRHKGLTLPEHLGKHNDCVDFILNYLANRGVCYAETFEELE